MGMGSLAFTERCDVMHLKKSVRGCLIEDVVPTVCMLVITFVGLYLRYTPCDFLSQDMKRFLIPWFQTIKANGGFLSLNQQVGDYGLLYQTIIAAFSYTDVSPVYLYKALSILFDFLLAGSTAYFISKTVTGKLCLHGIDYRKFLIYACVLLLPTVIMNSAFWGQCDSIYTFFLLWSLWFLYKEKYNLSFFLLGCSFAFKLQGIFLVPLFLFFCLHKKLSFSKFLITAFTFWFSGIIAYVHGRGLLDGFSVYLFQVGEYKRIWMNAPSFWFFFEENYEKYHILAICLTFVILTIVLLMLYKNCITISSFEQIIVFALFIEWTCIIFLPSMHERYTYVMDILTLILAFLDKKFIKYAIITIGTSCLTYNTYLFIGNNTTLVFVILYCLFFFFYIVAWLHFTFFSSRLVRNSQSGVSVG